MDCKFKLSFLKKNSLLIKKFWQLCIELEVIHLKAIETNNIGS